MNFLTNVFFWLISAFIVGGSFLGFVFAWFCIEGYILLHFPDDDDRGHGGSYVLLFFLWFGQL